MCLTFYNLHFNPRGIIKSVVTEVIQVLKCWFKQSICLNIKYIRNPTGSGGSVDSFLPLSPHQQNVVDLFPGVRHPEIFYSKSMVLPVFPQNIIYLYLKCLKQRYVKKIHLGFIYFFENESGRLRKLGDNTQTIKNDVIDHNFCQFRKTGILRLIKHSVSPFKASFYWTYSASF